MSIPGISGSNTPNWNPKNVGSDKPKEDDWVTEYNNFTNGVQEEQLDTNKADKNTYDNTLNEYVNSMEGIEDKTQNTEKKDDRDTANENVAEEMAKEDNWKTVEIQDGIPIPSDQSDKNNVQTVEVQEPIKATDQADIRDLYSKEEKQAIFEKTMKWDDTKQILSFLFEKSGIDFSKALSEENIQQIYDLVMKDDSIPIKEKVELLAKTNIDFSKIDSKMGKFIQEHNRANRKHGASGGSPTAQAASNEGLGTFGGLTIDPGAHTIAQVFNFNDGNGGGGGFDVEVSVGDTTYKYHEDGTGKS